MANAESSKKTPSKRKRTRAEKSLAAKTALFDAAEVVVGRLGYAQASVSRICEMAGLSQGSFYLHFESRQDLFDKLLPRVSEKAIEFIRAALHNSADIFDMEERGLRAFFEFLKICPGFLRILDEAEIYAPSAFEHHWSERTRVYRDILMRARDAGQIFRYSDEDIEVIVEMLMSARHRIYARYIRDSERHELPEWVAESYMRFVRNGLRAPDETGV